MFLRETMRLWHEVGAIAPSSRKLGAEMLRSLSGDRPMRVLEVGAGTGVFTSMLVERLGADSELHVAELNQKFCQALEQQISHWRLQPNCPTIQFHPGDVLNYRPEQRFDLIVSSLPFNSFPPDLIRAFLEYFRSVLQPDGQVAMFEYIGLRRFASTPFVNRHGAERRALYEAEVLPFIERHGHVLRNMPPARVCHIRFPAA